MTPTIKAYIKKLEELIDAWSIYETYCAEIIGLELEAGNLKQQIEEEEKTVSDEDDDKIELGEPDELPQKSYLTGWMCPRCGTVHSPFSLQCGCPPPTITRTSTDIGDSILNQPIQ